MVTKDQWCIPDTKDDLKEVEPAGQLLVGRDTPVNLRYYSVRQQLEGVVVNLYSRKLLGGRASYGFSISAELAWKLGHQLVEMARLVLRQHGKDIDG